MFFIVTPFADHLHCILIRLQFQQTGIGNLQIDPHLSQDILGYLSKCHIRFHHLENLCHYLCLLQQIFHMALVLLQFRNLLCLECQTNLIGKIISGQNL